MYCRVCDKEISEKEAELQSGCCESCFEKVKKLHEKNVKKNEETKMNNEELEAIGIIENVSKVNNSSEFNKEKIDEDLDAIGVTENFSDSDNQSKFKFENFLVIISIILIIIASIFVYKAFDFKNNYYNSENYPSLNKNTYVGGDAYNYIINSNYFSGYLNFAGSLYIISSICISVKVLKNKND